MTLVNRGMPGIGCRRWRSVQAESNGYNRVAHSLPRAGSRGRLEKPKRPASPRRPGAEACQEAAIRRAIVAGRPGTPGSGMIDAVREGQRLVRDLRAKIARSRSAQVPTASWSRVSGASWTDTSERIALVLQEFRREDFLPPWTSLRLVTCALRDRAILARRSRTSR